MAQFYLPEIKHGTNELSPEESKHAVKVLRLSSGDEIQLMDGEGGIYTAIIDEANHKRCSFHVVNTSQQIKNKHFIHIAIAPTKNIDRIEWFVEKCVEIGIDEISFISCQNSERKQIKIDRIEKKAVSAMKQSLNAFKPQLNDLEPFSSFVDRTKQKEKYIAYVDFENPDMLYNIASKSSEYCVLIGPEGDFSSKEVEYAINKGFKKISLGNTRLRTETAGIAACHLLNILNI